MCEYIADITNCFSYNLGFFGSLLLERTLQYTIIITRKTEDMGMVEGGGKGGYALTF